MSMELNREQKRQLQRMGALTSEGAPVRAQPSPKQSPERRSSLGQYLREVRAELKKVAWPTRPEVRKYSLVVLATVAFVTALVAGFDFIFGNFSLWLYDR